MTGTDDFSVRALRRTAELSHSLEQTSRHVVSEVHADVDEIMATIASGDVFWVNYFTPDGELPDGSASVRPLCRTITARKEARDYYQWFVDDGIDLERTVHSVDIVTDWYNFFESFVYGTDIRSGERMRGHHVVLISTRPDGIAGEILWPKHLSIAPDSPRHQDQGGQYAEASHELSLEMLSAYAKSDAAKVASLFQKDCYFAINDIDAELGVPTNLASRDAVGAYWRRIFEKFEVLGARPLNQVATSWYAFVDVAMTLRERGSGQTFELRTANVFGVGDDGLLAGHVGCRTRLIPVGADG